MNRSEYRKIKRKKVVGELPVSFRQVAVYKKESDWLEVIICIVFGVFLVLLVFEIGVHLGFIHTKIEVK
ncbi:hypothetical protein EQG49_13260 [Periweissella cryptocerci]|uniref:Uncharacterized protein n=1 Tax=Periweissella cryptocerci TaxID=2506420 RepID=A0A4V1AJ09_9LACO|nr:hypothetical protein [Periweissella cryptocerci]QBO37365.1 hypothetical protein EQG49_13260 [Periweissella cryptocerci]